MQTSVNDRKDNFKGGPFALVRIHNNLSAMVTDYLTGEAQSDTGPFGLGGIKRNKNFFQDLRRDGRSAIMNLNGKAMEYPFYRDPDLRIFYPIHGLGGILYEVDQNLLHLGIVCHDLKLPGPGMNGANDAISLTYWLIQAP